jgi:cell division protein FtsQ
VIEGLTDFRRKRRRRPAPRRRGARLRRAALVAVVAAALAGAAFGLAWLARGPWLEIARLELRGCQRQPESGIRDLCAPYLGQPLLLADIPRLRQAIEQLDTVASATVSRRLPDLLEVTIVERRPVARTTASGELRLVDAEGVVFAPGDPPGPVDRLPVLVGGVEADGGPRITEAGRRGLEALEAYARITGRPVPKDTSVDVSNEDRISLRPGDGSATLWLDRLDPARNLAQLLALRGRYGALARADVIDLRFSDRLTVVSPTGATEGR